MRRLGVLVCALLLLGCSERVRASGISGGYRYSFEPPSGWVNMGERNISPRYVLRDEAGAHLAVLTVCRTAAHAGNQGCNVVGPLGWRGRRDAGPIEAIGLRGQLFMCRGISQPGGVVVAALDEPGDIDQRWLVMLRYMAPAGSTPTELDEFVPVVEDVLATLEARPR